MQKLLRYLTHHHVLVNLITVLVFVGGFLAWDHTNKEELPDVTFNTVSISTAYSGASAEDVEFYVTDPMEEALVGLDGIRKITSTSGPGTSVVTVELSNEVTDIDRMVTDIQGQVDTVDLPSAVLDDPYVRVFETSKKAIIDIAIYHEDISLMTVQDRLALQLYARGLETQLTVRPEIFEIRYDGYLNEEININVNPEKSSHFDISLNTIGTEIQRSHVRAPAGTLNSGKLEQVTVLSELDRKDKLEKLVIQGGFDSQVVPLGDVASINDGFEKHTTIYKVNGREAIIMNVVKNSGYGILESLAVVKDVVESYQENALADTGVLLRFLDDESINVRNRLSIIGSNGLMGFGLILLSLFVFLNIRSGFWVAMGIPFTLCFTLVAGYFMGYTINGVTLAAVIIVLGIVVDDAIVLAENISRRWNEGESLSDAAVKGTLDVMSPVLASSLTTCAAFIPLYFFSGRFGDFVSYIPTVIFFMLFASLLESFLLLPGHMILFPAKRNASPTKVWFTRWEQRYQQLLARLLPLRYGVLAFFLVLLVIAGYVGGTHLKFVMFPNEESREVVLSGTVDGATNSSQTAQHIQGIEDYLTTYIGKEGVGVRSVVAQGRRGDVSQENEFRTTLELVPSDERDRTTNEIIAEIDTQLKRFTGISNLKFRKDRFGQSSGSVFEIVLAESDDLQREALVNTLIQELEKEPGMINVEPDLIPLQQEYILDFNQDELKRLAVNPSNISSTLRAALSGTRLYTIERNDEDVDVNLTVELGYQDSIADVLKVPVENNQNYLIPLGELLHVTPIMAKKSIRRENQKRISYVYADLAEDAASSPLELADDIEATVFPALLTQFPNAQLSFSGEVVDTRESQQDLRVGILTALGLIYLVLAIQFDSIVKPLRIMLVIPFGVIAVVFAFYAHQKFDFGFYAAIGTLGMLGVVVNDAIVMLSKLDNSEAGANTNEVAAVAKTRLRAILLTTLTTVAGVMPTAYGIGGYDSMLSDMMIALAWGLLFGTLISLFLIPCVYMIEKDIRRQFAKLRPSNGAILSVLIALGCVFSPSTVYAEDATTLGLTDFIQQAAQNDTVFHGLLIQRLAFEYDQDLNVEASEFTASLASDFVVNTSAETDAHTFTLGKTMPSRGQELSLSYDHSLETLSFSFSQDIAQNAFGRSNLLDEKIQSLKTEIAQYQLVEAYEDYLATLMALYYTWIRQYESWNLAKSAYAETEKVYESILDRQARKIANETDVNKLLFQRIEKEEQVLDFESEYLQTTTQIKRAIGLSPTSNIMPNSEVLLDTKPPSLAQAIADIEASSRTFIVLSKLSEKLEHLEARAAQDLLPSAELSASIVGSEADSYGLLGLSVDWPLVKAKSKATLETATISRQETELENQSAADALRTQLRSLYFAIDTQSRLITMAAKKRDVAESILDDESENYSYGKITLNDYITAVNRFDTARFNELDAKITYQQLSLEWKRLSDQLVVKALDDL